jgi:hypothetical protein
MTDAEIAVTDALGELLRTRKQPATVGEIAVRRGGSVQSARTVLTNLSRERYGDARPLLSGGTYSDGSLYGPSRRVERSVWTEQAEGGRWLLTEDGWFWFLRRDFARASGHFGTPSEEIRALAREYYRLLAGQPSGLNTP